MKIPLATANEKGYVGCQTAPRRRSKEFRAVSLLTGGPGCSEAPPSVAQVRTTPVLKPTVPRPSREGTLRLPPSPILLCLSSRTTPHWVLLLAAVAGSREALRSPPSPRAAANGSVQPGGPGQKRLLDFLYVRVEWRVTVEKGDGRVQPPPGMRNSGKPEPASLWWMRTSPFS